MINAVKLKPAFKDYLWGGNRLKTEFGKQTELETVAESWELSVHPDGESTLCDGTLLSQYITREMLGKNAQRFEYFPILIKFIDAKTNLSVQVHPSDSYALENEGEYGKTEMWYVLDATPDAFLYYGFKKDITKNEYKDAIQNNTLCDILNRVEVKKGDVFFIPAGTVHAIGGGCLICEIQQNSNTTYRVYDYNRRDKDGNMRPLHIDKALEVSCLSESPKLTPTRDDDDVTLAECEYFTVRRLKIKDEKKLCITDKSFHSLIVTNGSGSIGDMSFTKGDSIFIPACESEYTLSGDCEIILSYIGEEKCI